MSYRVLVVDDSAIVPRILQTTLDSEPDIEVAGVAPDPYVGRNRIIKLKPDVLTLDIEVPRMDGLTFLKRLMRYHPMPVIVISSVGNSSCEMAMEAIRIPAVRPVLPLDRLAGSMMRTVANRNTGREVRIQEPEVRSQ